MGCLEIDEHSGVLGSDSWPVPDLYAAGEVAGGATATIGGNSVLDCVIFGRVARALKKMEGSKLAGGSSEDALVLHGRVLSVYWEKRMI